MRNQVVNASWTPTCIGKVIGASRLFLLIILNSHLKLTDFKFLIKSNKFVGEETFMWNKMPDGGALCRADCGVWTCMKRFWLSPVCPEFLEVGRVPLGAEVQVLEYHGRWVHLAENDDHLFVYEVFVRLERHSYLRLQALPQLQDMSLSLDHGSTNREQEIQRFKEKVSA